jgi:hypothetical protein
MSRLKILTFLTLFALLLAFVPALAQEEARPPQFLYRDGARLVLVNAETGEAEVLADIYASQRDSFQWSPDGQYLRGMLNVGEGQIIQWCLNLYDVDAQMWLSDKPVACDVDEAVFSHDATRIAYAINDLRGTGNGILWVYEIASGTHIKLWETTDGSKFHPEGINNIAWSPNDQCLNFDRWGAMMGGNRNSLGIVCLEPGQPHFFTGGTGYYALYDPVWSPDDEWVLLVLQEEYVTSGSLPFTNHQGDLYLINAIDGQSYRLTHTPAKAETNVHWTADGEIAYDIQQLVRLTVNDAAQVEAPDPSEIVTPEPINPLDYPVGGVYRLPDGRIGAWISPTELTTPGDSSRTLHIGVANGVDYMALLPDNYENLNVIIGWRPTGAAGE